MLYSLIITDKAQQLYLFPNSQVKFNWGGPKFSPEKEKHILIELAKLGRRIFFYQMVANCQLRYHFYCNYNRQLRGSPESLPFITLKLSNPPNRAP